MTNLIVVLLFVLFPPPEVIVAQPDAAPLVQAEQIDTLDHCKAGAAALIATARANSPGSSVQVACIAVPAPDAPAVSVKPGLQPDGNVLTPDGAVIAPRPAI